MRHEPSYVPKQRKVNYKIVVPFILFMMIISVFAFKKIYDDQIYEDKGFKVCNLSSKDTERILRKNLSEYENYKYTQVQDYSFYGETLKFYENDFDFHKTDPFIGNTVFLNNLCGTDIEDKKPYLLSHDLDIGIQLDTLEDGFYVMEILRDFDYYLLETDENIEFEFSSIKRSNQIKEVKVFANQEMINKYYDEPLLRHNLVFLEVSTVETNNQYDIVLDPAGLTYYDNEEINYGHFYQDVFESEYTYSLATKVKNELEKHGLRVYLTRDNENPINYFDNNGRIIKAYESNAKYYVHMRFESSGSNMDRGLNIFYSNFTSNRFASSVTKAILNGTKFKPSPYEDGINGPGVYQTSLIDGYDFNDWIRETGGMLTGAGQLEGYPTVYNQSKRGMYSIDILYGYMTDHDDLSTWVEDIDQIAKQTAEGILSQLGIKGD
ncbi:MAG: hypothetical protein GX984_01985 [Erysipelothrix sp.]|nr:hypothetical protein [Erysipelothrix sp.]